MPARTIYVRDEDEEVWREAERLSAGGSRSLSAVVVDALRFYVRTKQERFGVVGVRLDRDEQGRPVPLHTVRFAAIVLAGDDRTPRTTAYLTPKGNIVLFRREADGPAAAGGLHVFPSLEQAQLATGPDGRPLYGLAFLARVAERLASLEGRTIPNDIDTEYETKRASGIRQLDI